MNLCYINITKCFKKSVKGYINLSLIKHFHYDKRFDLLSSINPLFIHLRRPGAGCNQIVVVKITGFQLRTKTNFLIYSQFEQN